MEVRIDHTVPATKRTYDNEVYVIRAPKKKKRRCRALTTKTDKMDRQRGRERSESRDRGSTSRKRGRSRDRSSERDYSREGDHSKRNIVLAVLKTVRPLDRNMKDEIIKFACSIDRDVKCSEKDSKELFVGNVVDEDASENNLCLLMNSAMRALGLVNNEDEPIVRCRKSKNYCFIVFKSALECSMALNLNGIPFKNAALRIKRPADYPGRTDAVYTWQDLVTSKAEQRTAPVVHTPVASATKLAPHPATLQLREIFIGNTNDNMTEETLMDLIGGAMMKMGLSHSRNEHPVDHVRITGKFAFMVMRTCLDAANVLNLNGIPFCGTHLKLMRTKKYDGGGGIEAYLTWEMLLKMWLNGDLRLMTSGQPTRVIVVTNVTTPDALASDPNLYLDIIEDMRLECSQFGAVRSVIVPRSTSALNSGSAGASGANNPVGKVFVEMETVDQAILTLLSLKGRSFDSRIVDVKFYPEDAFRSMNYAVPCVCPVITASYGATPLDKIFTPAALAKIQLEEGF